MNIKIVIGILIPFIGAVIGSGLIYLIKNDFTKKRDTLLFGVSSGLMLGASIYTLILPSISLANIKNLFPLKPILFGCVLGILFIYVSDIILTKMTERNKMDNSIRENLLFFFSITLHNIPEGMAIGVAFSTLIVENVCINFAAIIALVIGITLQNIPEATVVSLIYDSNGYSKMKSFIYGVISSAVEPIAAIITILFVKNVNNILVYLLNFAAGAMIYVTIFDLIPKSKSCKNKYENVLWITLGFVFMMLSNIVIK